MKMAIKLILILFFLSYISARYINFYDSYKSINDIITSETFIIYFNIPFYISYTKKDYMHIKISSKNDRNQVIAILSDDISCKNDRISVGIHEYSPINFFFKKEEKSYFFIKYLCVECKNEENCKYDIEIESGENCELNFGEKYSYYVTKENTEMQFQFKNKDSVSSNFNLWVKGQKITQAIVSGSGGEIKNFEYGLIFRGFDNSYDDYNRNYGMNIISEEGDFVTVGSIMLDENDEYNSRILKINDIEIMSYLPGSKKKFVSQLKKIIILEIF